MVKQCPRIAGPHSDEGMLTPWCSCVQELNALLKVRQGSILETELDYLRSQQQELPALDHFDALNAECSGCA